MTVRPTGQAHSAESAGAAAAVHLEISVNDISVTIKGKTIREENEEKASSFAVKSAALSSAARSRYPVQWRGRRILHS